jgi:DNA-binding NtrC family response regulator
VLGASDEWISESDLPFDLLIREEGATLPGPKEASIDLGLLRARQQFERAYILRALRRCRWNQTDTARLLKIHRNTLIQKIRILELRSQSDE